MNQGRASPLTFPKYGSDTQILHKFRQNNIKSQEQSFTVKNFQPQSCCEINYPSRAIKIMARVDKISSRIFVTLRYEWSGSGTNTRLRTWLVGRKIVFNVCPSVCLSVRHTRHSGIVKTRECRGMQSSLSGSRVQFSVAKNGRCGRPRPGKFDCKDVDSLRKQPNCTRFAS